MTTIGLLYLNDGDREDAPEYAALKIDRVVGLMVSGREVGRIRPLGMDARKAGQFVRELKQGRWTTDSFLKVKAEPEWHHGCELCEFQEDRGASSLILGSKGTSYFGQPVKI